MSKVTEVKDLLSSAQIVVCVENTYIPNRAGQRLQLDDIRKTLAYGTQLDGDKAGQLFRLTFPKRVGDVVAVDGDSCTYRIGRDDHTVTYRVIERRTE